MNWSRDPETTTDPVTTHVSSHDSVTAAIVSAIADAHDCAIDDLGPVYELIDLEAFNSLYTNSDQLTQTDLQITFTVAGCKVILYGDGRIVVMPIVDHQSNAQTVDNNREPGK